MGFVLFKKGLCMKIQQNSSPVNFRAYISPELEHQIERQLAATAAGNTLNVKKTSSKS